jgi:glutathione S-transferase
MEFIDIEAAKTAPGVRIVASTVVPSPWSEAAKAVFTIAGVPFVVVRATPRDPAVFAWTRAHNVPVVFHDSEPARTIWSQIVTLADRLAEPGRVLPRDLPARVEDTGLLHEIAGEHGLGWNARLLMIHASVVSNGARGFPLPVATYLGAKYGYSAHAVDIGRARSREILAALATRLGDAPYFGGDAPNALDAYCATFQIPLAPIDDAVCPAMQPPLRAAFGVAADELGPFVPPALVAHRKRMYAHHLASPIAI